MIYYLSHLGISIDDVDCHTDWYVASSEILVLSYLHWVDQKVLSLSEFLLLLLFSHSVVSDPLLPHGL